MKITRLPRNDKTNAWNTILAPRRPTRRLEREIAADWLVVGAGYAGLAAARRLAENRPDETVALVEAGRIGENASARNSGFAIDLPHTVSSNLDELDGSVSYMRLARAAITHLEDLVKTHEIACDWSRDGKYHAAVTAEGSRALLDPVAAELDALGEPYEWLEADALRAALGTAHFHRAIYTPGTVLMNPAALTRGLADTLPGNVTLYEETPVTSIEYANGVQIETPAGRVRAPRMILAANGFSERFGFLKRRFVHFAARASLTRPLTPSEEEAYGVEKPWGLTPANAFAGITMRFTNDRRILIRHEIKVAPKQHTTDAELGRTAANHKRLFDARFPMLPEVTMENTWTGYVAMSRNGAPAFGKIAPNVWVAACQNAIGVTKGTISGLLAAELACGRENALIADMESLGTPVELPPKIFTTLGARAKVGWEVWRNRHEA